jgi:hypothetical protein
MLIDCLGSAESDPEDKWVEKQALFCPYYETLEGPLGSDWGVILNPQSPKFGRLVFEHSHCGCPDDHPSSQETAAWLRGHARHKWEALNGRVCVQCGQLDGGM